MKTKEQKDNLKGWCILIIIRLYTASNVRSFSQLQRQQTRILLLAWKRQGDSADTCSGWRNRQSPTLNIVSVLLEQQHTEDLFTWWGQETKLTFSFLCSHGNAVKKGVFISLTKDEKHPSKKCFYFPVLLYFFQVMQNLGNKKHWDCCWVNSCFDAFKKGKCFKILTWLVQPAISATSVHFLSLIQVQVVGAAD